MAVCSEAELPFSAHNPPFPPHSESFSKDLLLIQASAQIKDLQDKFQVCFQG